MWSVLSIVKRMRICESSCAISFCSTALQSTKNALNFHSGRADMMMFFISNLIIFYNKLHFVDIVELRGSNPPSFHRSEATAFSWFFKGLRAFTAARRGTVPKSYAQKASPVFDLCWRVCIFPAAIPLLWRIILLFLEYANFASVSPFVKRYSSALFPNFCIMRVHPLHIHMFMKISAFDEFLAKVMQFLMVSVIPPPS